MHLQMPVSHVALKGRGQAGAVLRHEQKITDDSRPLLLLLSIGKQEQAGALLLPSKAQLWERYLKTVAADTQLTEEQRAKIADAWKGISSAQHNVSFPNAGVDDDGNFYFGWNNSHRSLDIEFRRDGSVYWFFSDHHHGLVVSSEQGHGETQYRALLSMFAGTPSFRNWTWTR